MRISAFAAALLAAAFVRDCLGADPSGPATSVPDDITNYEGDRVSFNDDIIATIQRADGNKGDQVCIPAHLKLRGGVGYTANGTSNSGTTETGTLFRLLKKPKPVECKNGKPVADNTPDPDKKSAAGTSAQANAKSQPQRSLLERVVEFVSGTPAPLACNPSALPEPEPPVDFACLTQGVDLQVSKETLDRSPPNRYGLTYGLLAVPFKYHLSGAKDFTGSGTVGPYVGYRTQNSGFGYGISYILFLGGSNISVTQASNGNAPATTQNLAGFSYGVGAIATIKGHFQLGGVLGFDRVSSNANFQYQGKPWIALELGYSFLQ